MNKYLGKEIERKFLLTEIPFDLSGYDRVEIKQGYIFSDPAIRLRRAGDTYYLTVKVKEDRSEYEVSLTEEQFVGLWKKTEPGVVEKTRYLIPLDDGYTAEVDVYRGHLDGFLTVEVEFPDEAAEAAFVPPPWFGAEVTGDYRYSNAELARHGKNGL
ncbi:MAG: CYTH domain-containing protein [Defluviitaleaceae bacterium]|nr:CYTH domain-containing protein [Defluviitaleaceae bacterium]